MKQNQLSVNPPCSKPFYLVNYLYKKANIVTKQQDIQEDQHYN
jgi:hypothetical protein